MFKGMSILFEPYRIRGLTLRNRFMRSATTSYWADDEGIVKDAHVRLYRSLARGGVGLIVKGHLYVSENGKAHTGMAGISSDRHIPMLRRLTDAVHEQGGRIAAQINHAGVVHQPDRAGPSAYNEDGWTAREMTVDEIEAAVEAYGDAAERAMQAGFDGVQIHGAHGYLVSQFLSRLVNRRTDRWGGSPENRMRFLMEVYDEVRGRVGNQPVLIKMNCDDFSPDGFTVDDSVEVAVAIAERGVDLIEVSGGGRGQQEALRARARHSDPAYAELAFAGHASKIRDATRPTPMALVYGFRKLETMRRAVEMGLTDMVSMSRPFIREPDLVRRLQSGQREVSCTRCDACRGDDVFGKTMLRCQLE
jgi:2,4-dienoyl-CoA reductase-like NADH-dependent reductase (Old Yellow Enzyme family)